MKITLEIECTGPGKWGLDMSRGTLCYAHGEDIAEGTVCLRIARGLEKIMTELEGGAHGEFLSASKGPEEL